jgi:hypothetical protein
VGRYGRAGQATDDSITRLMHMRVNKPTNTHFCYATLTAFHCNNGITNARLFYDICILPVLLVCIRMVSRISISLQCSTFSPQITSVCDFLRHALYMILF